MAGHGLVNIAIDGVDKVGKSTIANTIEDKYGLPAISADVFRVVANAPLEIRIWADIPILGVLRKLEKSCIIDRSIISVLVYNRSNHDIIDKLMPFVEWYKNKTLFVYNTFCDLKTVLERMPGIDGDDLLIQDLEFGFVYAENNIDPIIVYAEDSIDDKVEKIMNSFMKMVVEDIKCMC